MVPVLIRRDALGCLLASAVSLASAQSGTAEPGFVCPMDKDVRSKTPGTCARCGMRLVPEVADAREFRVRIASAPARPVAGRAVRISLQVLDPASGDRPVRRFEIMHERLFHLFLVSRDLSFFQHIHPGFDSASESFQIEVTLPRPGMYRLLSDFYPSGATPQLVAGTVLVPGPGFSMEPVSLVPDLSPQQGRNLRVELICEPAQPLAGFKTLLFFRLSPASGLEPYLGAMGHMLAASADLIDMMHVHPAYVTDAGSGTAQLQFNMIFPREGVHRVWVQFQRSGIVNTVAFSIPVERLR